MPIETITLNLPTPLAQELNAVSQEFLLDILERGLRQFKIERALERYSQGGISFGAAAQQAEVSQSELARYAYARGLEPPFSDQTVQEELG
ncbi:MAG: hypothetical protein KDI62_17200 [Anaerolineae bacterium]|nr:hypothetical protein [Anaerolineae bacterium]MCB9109422.1 hypothetical protein [Anaerolineales bacterium]